VPSPKDHRITSRNYRKPPVEHQFKKGRSGNPKGRPRKKAVQRNLGASGGGIADRLNAMALDEATRLVTVREGDKVSEIPAMQALLRTMFRAAAEGDTRAARQLLELTARAESGRAATATEILEFASDYKKTLLPIFEEHEREGLEPPDIYPHPDDIIIDEATGEVTIDGPTTKDQAAARKAIRERAFESLREFFEVEAALKKDPSNRALRQKFRELKKYFDFLKKDAARNTRLEALRLSRETLEPKPPEPKDDTPGEA
jgi:Family of unknown function (DUF5681)